MTQGLPQGLLEGKVAPVNPRVPSAVNGNSVRGGLFLGTVLILSENARQTPGFLNKACSLAMSFVSFTS